MLKLLVKNTTTMAIRCHGSYNIFKNNNNMKIIKRGMAKKKGRNQQQQKGQEERGGVFTGKLVPGTEEWV